jgi:GT2 family glycosyltransferase
MIDLSVSLISLNQREDLARLLPTLQPAAEAANAEILVVDNRSRDGTDEFLRANYPQVRAVHNEARAGYGENHNLNLARAQGRYFLIMNTDMVLHDADGLARLRDYMDDHPQAAISTLKVLNEDGTIQGLNKRYPTVLDLFLRGVLPRRWQPLFQQRMNRYEMRDVGYDAECDVEFISGAFMFCRTQVLKDLGGFDPGYFLYFEDVDLCRRVQLSHRTVYVPVATAAHFWRRDAHKSRMHRKWFVGSSLRYFRRWGFKLV